MKATFFTLATMAASVFAAPAPAGDGLGDILTGTPWHAPEGPPVPATVPGASGDGSLGDLVDGLPKPDAPTGVTETRQLPDAPADLGGIDGLVELLNGLVEQLTGSFDNINAITEQVDAGETSADEAEPAVLDELSSIELNLKNIITQLTGQAGIPVAEGDVQRVLTVLEVLLDVLLTNVNALVTILGLRPQLVSILHSVFTLLANLLTLVTGLVAGLVPGLIAALSPLLAGLGNGLLAPLLTPVAALLARLSGV